MAEKLYGNEEWWLRKIEAENVRATDIPLLVWDALMADKLIYRKYTPSFDSPFVQLTDAGRAALAGHDAPETIDMARSHDNPFIDCHMDSVPTDAGLLVDDALEPLPGQLVALLESRAPGEPTRAELIAAVIDLVNATGVAFAGQDWPREFHAAMSHVCTLLARCQEAK